jgi:phytoene dehydrogenase-like protein
MQANEYDAIIIGAGMSGLAAGIRLAMFDKKVCILEKHLIAGGLNSYYQRKNQQAGGLRKFDVGLHALTNFVKKGEKRKPFTKLLKQLRIPYDSFQLQEQNYSKIQFDDCSLKFNNEFEYFKNEIFDKFPHQKDQFSKLLNHIEGFDELNLNQGYTSTRKVLSEYLDDELLQEMILCPLLIYGSAWEEDMDFAQFVIMFKSIYQEGFSRPENGVRTIINLLTEKFQSLGGELRFKTGVEEIIIKNDKAIGVKTNKGEFFSEKVFSSMGYPETVNKCHGEFPAKKPKVGNMSFMESILVLDKKNPARTV